MTELRITAFGPLRAWVGDRQVDLGGAKNRALFGYLAFDLMTGRSRAHLAALLWPDADDERSKQSLRSALYQLRRSLDAAADVEAEQPNRPSDDLLSIDSSTVAFRSDASIASDIVDFSRALDQVAAHDHDDILLCDPCMRNLQDAADAYRGDFLEDVVAANSVQFEDWLLLHRESLRNQALRILDRLVQIHIKRAEHVEAHDRAFQILALNRYDEFAHRVIISTLASQGQFDQALSHYDTTVSLLQSELAVTPSDEMRELAESIRSIAKDAETQTESARIVSLAVEQPEPRSAVDEAPPSAANVETSPRRNIQFLRNAAFVGRSAELAQLAELLVPPKPGRTEPASAVVSGIGGIGKTQLAIEFAYRHRDEFEGGVHWINCADPESVAREVAAIGAEGGLDLFRTNDGLSLHEQVESVRTRWRTGPPLLLIFDNCDDVSIVLDWLPRQGQSSVLITSRKGEWPFEMPLTEVPLRSLHRDDSVEYMTTVAKHLDPQDAALVAEEIGDHPLALRFAAQFLSRLPGLTVASYIAQLRESPMGSHASFQMVDGDYWSTDSERAGLRAFSLSMQRVLDDSRSDMATQVLGRLLCVAPGLGLDRMFLLETLADLTDAAAMIEADRGVQVLLDHGMVTSDEHRQIVMHRLVNSYVTSVLDDASIAAARSAVEETVCASINPETFAGPEDVFECPITDLHLGHVVQQAIEHNSPLAPILALARGRRLRQEWDTAGAIEQLHAGLDVAARTNAPIEQGRILVELVVAEFQHGAVAEMMTHASNAVEIFEGVDPGVDVWLAVALDRLTMAYLLTGRIDEAFQVSARSLALARTTDNPRVLARCLRLMGQVEGEARGNFTIARELMTEALEVLDEHDHREALATTLDYLGMVCSQQGDYAEAARVHARAAELCAVTTKRNLALMYVAGAFLDDARPAEALEVLVHEVDGAVGNSLQLQTLYLLFLARAYVGTGQTSDGLDAIQQAFEIADDFADRTVTAHRWRVAALVAAATDGSISPHGQAGERVEASTCFGRAVEVFDSLGFQNSRVAATVLEWAEWEHSVGNTELARALNDRGAQMLVELNAPHLKASG